MKVHEVINENICGKNKNKIYSMMISAIGVGPFDGGCVVMAQAIQIRYGGEIVVLVGQAQRNVSEEAQHAAVKFNNTLIDYAGAFEPHEFIDRFEQSELAHSGGHITGVRPMQDGNLPDTPRNTKLASQIARLLK